MTTTINGRTPEEIRKGQSFSEYLDEKLSKVNVSSLEDEDQEQKKRTPEETKKGLSLCYADVCDCSECPYFNMEDCDKKLASDVLMLFQQLERERDAAVERLRGWCEVCVHWENEDSIAFCDGCTHNYPFEHETNFTDRWQWRGVQEVE